MKEMENIIYMHYCLLSTVAWFEYVTCYCIIQLKIEHFSLLISFYFVSFRGEKNNQKEKKSQRTQMIIVH